LEKRHVLLDCRGESLQHLRAPVGIAVLQKCHAGSVR
jgi:hypothetical protein